MKINKLYLLGLLLGLPYTHSYGQTGADPAVLSPALQPAPIAGGVGSPFTLSFAIGNNGGTTISGTNFINQMRFTITLNQCTPNPAVTDAISGSVLDYFTLVYNPLINSIIATQKTGIALAPRTTPTLTIAAVVTRASSSTAIDDIGAACNVQPNPTANPQPTDNDFASVYTHTVANPMPVALFNFRLDAQLDRTVLVSWQTSWEKVNQKFIIERSKDLKNFEAVGEMVDVAGTSNSLSSYRFVDKNPYRGVSYYRLRQVDIDGSSHSHPAASVIIEGQYGIYPNPIIGKSFTVELDEPTTARLRLYNPSGQEIGITTADPTEWRTQVTTNVTLSSGIYLLKVEERGQQRTHRIIVP